MICIGLYSQFKLISEFHSVLNIERQRIETDFYKCDVKTHSNQVTRLSRASSYNSDIDFLVSEIYTKQFGKFVRQFFER